MGASVYLPLLAGVAYFTRATRRRFLGAVAGGLSVAVVGVGIEALCQTLGIWRYPSSHGGFGLPLAYPLVVPIWALLALLGWRVVRRFGWRGQAVFLAAVAAAGALRDYAVAVPMGFITVASGPFAVLVDATCWAVTTALTQATMRIVAGPAGADPLARRAGEWKSRRGPTAP